MFVRPPRPLHRLQGFAVVVLVALAIDLLAETALMLTGPRLATSAAALADRADLDADMLLHWLLLLLRLPTAVLAGGAFMLWLLQARLNAESLTGVPHRWFQIFILLGWFIPIVNCWLPKQIVDDVWAASRPGGVRGERIGMETHSGLVWAWWISWVAASCVKPLQLELLAAPDHRSRVAPVLIDTLFLLPSLVAAVLCAAVVLRITHFQENRLALHRPPVRNQ